MSRAGELKEASTARAPLLEEGLAEFRSNSQYTMHLLLATTPLVPLCCALLHVALLRAGVPDNLLLKPGRHAKALGGDGHRLVQLSHAREGVAVLIRVLSIAHQPVVLRLQLRYPRLGRFLHAAPPHTPFVNDLCAVAVRANRPTSGGALQVSKYVSGAASRQLPALHGWGNLAGHVDTPASPVLPLEGAGRGPPPFTVPIGHLQHINTLPTPRRCTLTSASACARRWIPMACNR